MNLRVAIQMDPLAGINPKSDSTLRLGLEAQARGHRLFYYTPDTLSWREGAVSAVAHPVKFFADESHYFELGNPSRTDLSTMDVVLLRQDPPFNMHYITTTYLLERIHPKTLVVNDPASVRNCAEKIFPFEFQRFMPPTLVTSDIAEMERFQADHKDIVIKPLYGYAGHSVFRVAPGENVGALLAKHFSGHSEPLIAQKFLPEVKDGDRRIILIDGEVGGVLGRIPAENEIRANFRVGGTAAKAELTPRQRECCEALKPVLKARGLLFAGIDMIGDYLTEINLTSPTGLAYMTKLYGIKLEANIWDVIEKRTSLRGM